MVMTTTDTLIIGAGPYGLALANHLHETGHDFAIVGKPMDLWLRHTFANADLRSNVPTSEISAPQDKYSFASFFNELHPDEEVPAERVSVERYREYIGWMLKRVEYPINECHVTNVERRSGTYHVTLETGEEMTAERVVVASGVAHHLHIPDFLNKDDRVVHSYQVGQIEDMIEKKVLVIGAGQSAAEAMDLLVSNGNIVHWYSRKEPRYFAEPLRLPTWIFNIVVRSAELFRALPHRLVQRVFGIFSASTITPDHEELLRSIPRCSRLPALDEYEHIVAATGYRYSVKFLEFLSEEIRSGIQLERDMPVVDHDFGTSIPGLYFIGPITEQFFGPPMKFMMGSRYAGPRLAAHLTT